MKKGKEAATSRNNVKFEINPDVKQGQTLVTLDKLSNTTIEPTNGPNFTFRGSPATEKQKNVMRKRESFSLTQTTYMDARTLWHPLKDSSTPILNDQATIEKMKKSQRFPVPETILHKPADFQLHIDSLMNDAYNSDENDDWTSIRDGLDMECPANSIESIEHIDFQSSSDDD